MRVALLSVGIGLGGAREADGWGSDGTDGI